MNIELICLGGAMTDLLYQIMLAVLVVAAVFLVLILWRLYLIMSDASTATSIFTKRIQEFDREIDKFKESWKNYKDSITGFITGFKSIKKIKEIFTDLKKNKKNKEENE